MSFEEAAHRPLLGSAGVSPGRDEDQESVSTVARRASTSVRGFEAACRDVQQGNARSLVKTVETAMRAADVAKRDLAVFQEQQQRQQQRLTTIEKKRNANLYEKLIQEFQAALKDLETRSRGAAEAQRELTAISGRKEDDPFEGSAQRSLQSQQRQQTEDAVLRDTINFNNEDLQQREEAFGRLQSDVQKINGMYRQVAVLVEQQGESVNQIGNLMEETHNLAQSGLDELQRSKMYKRRINPYLCWFAILLLLVVAVMITLLATHKI